MADRPRNVGLGRRTAETGCRKIAASLLLAENGIAECPPERGMTPRPRAMPRVSSAGLTLSLERGGEQRATVGLVVGGERDCIDLAG